MGLTTQEYWERPEPVSVTLKCELCGKHFTGTAQPTYQDDLGVNTATLVATDHAKAKILLHQEIGNCPGIQVQSENSK